MNKLQPVSTEKFYLLLHPRPAYIIGSGRYGEKINFMAASWVTPIAEEPPRLCVAIDVESYTHELIKGYGEFTVNIYPVNRVDELYFVGTVSGRDMDKASTLGLKVVQGFKVRAPALADALACIECKVAGEFESEDTTLFIGDVVHVAVDDEAFDTKKGWLIPRVNIPLHNWGRGFYSVGSFVLAKRKKA